MLDLRPVLTSMLDWTIRWCDHVHRDLEQNQPLEQQDRMRYVAYGLILLVFDHHEILHWLFLNVLEWEYCNRNLDYHQMEHRLEEEKRMKIRSIIQTESNLNRIIHLLPFHRVRNNRTYNSYDFRFVKDLRLNSTNDCVQEDQDYRIVVEVLINLCLSKRIEVNSLMILILRSFTIEIVCWSDRKTARL